MGQMGWKLVVESERPQEVDTVLKHRCSPQLRSLCPHRWREESLRLVTTPWVQSWRQEDKGNLG